MASSVRSARSTPTSCPQPNVVAMKDRIDRAELIATWVVYIVVTIIIVVTAVYITNR